MAVRPCTQRAPGAQAIAREKGIVQRIIRTGRHETADIDIDFGEGRESLVQLRPAGAELYAETHLADIAELVAAIERGEAVGEIKAGLLEAALRIDVHRPVLDLAAHGGEPVLARIEEAEILARDLVEIADGRAGLDLRAIGIEHGAAEIDGDGRVGFGVEIILDDQAEADTARIRHPVHRAHDQACLAFTLLVGVIDALERAESIDPVEGLVDPGGFGWLAHKADHLAFQQGLIET